MEPSEILISFLVIFGLIVGTADSGVQYHPYEQEWQLGITSISPQKFADTMWEALQTEGFTDKKKAWSGILGKGNDLIYRKRIKGQKDIKCRLSMDPGNFFFKWHVVDDELEEELNNKILTLVNDTYGTDIKFFRRVIPFI